MAFWTWFSQLPKVGYVSVPWEGSPPQPSDPHLGSWSSQIAPWLKAIRIGPTRHHHGTTTSAITSTRHGPLLFWAWFEDQVWVGDFFCHQKKGVQKPTIFQDREKNVEWVEHFKSWGEFGAFKGAANKGPVDHKSPGFATDSYGAIWIGVRGRTVLFQGEQKHQRLRMSNQKNMDMGVSKNSGTPKWMVYNGKPY